MNFNCVEYIDKRYNRGFNIYFKDRCVMYYTIDEIITLKEYKEIDIVFLDVLYNISKNNMICKNVNYFIKDVITDTNILEIINDLVIR